MAYPTTPVRQYSFTDHSTNNPTTPQPGDRLDSEIDRSNQSITDVVSYLGVSLNTDGTLKSGSVGQTQLLPGLFDFISNDAIADVQPLVDQAQGYANSAQGSATTATNSASAAAASATTASGAATAAGTSQTAAATSASDALTRSNTAQTAATNAGNSDNHATGQANLATDLATLAQAWAEHMPDTIPAGILAAMGITGSHWSARWWANQAQVNQANYLQITGGTLTGPLILAADPAQVLGAATKQYVDARAWREAPVDANTYGRSNSAWIALPSFATAPWLPLAGGTMNGAIFTQSGTRPFQIAGGAAAPVSWPANTTLQVAGADTGQNRIVFDAFGGGTSLLIGRQSPGIAANPALNGATLTAKILLGLQGQGWNGTAYATGGQISIFSSEQWSATAQGANITFGTTPNGTVAFAYRMRLANDGALIIDPSGIFTNDGVSKLQVNGAATADTAAPGTNTRQLATTAFVAAAVAAATAGVATFNGRTGTVVLTGADLTAAGGALLASPALTGVPTAPTAAAGTATTQIATTNFVAGGYLPLTGGTLTGNLAMGTSFGAQNSTAAATFQNGLYQAWITPRTLAGDTNPIVQANDTLITAAASAVNVANIVIGPWSNIPLGVRISASAGTVALSGTHISVSQDPVNNLDVATKQYSDLKLPLAGGTMTGPLLQTRATNPFVVRDVGLAGTLPAWPANTLFGIASGANSRMTLLATGGAPLINGSVVEGSLAAPLPINLNRVLLAFNAQGYDGAAYHNTGAAVFFTAAQNWSPTARGTKIDFQTTHNDATTITNRVRIDHDGALIIDATGVLANNGTDALQVLGTGKINQIALAADPTQALQAATKQYVDALRASVTSGYLPLTGGVLSGDLEMGANYGAPNSNAAATFSNGVYQAWITARTLAGDMNPIVQVNDTLLTCASDTLAATSLTIAPWSNTALGIRISAPANSVTITAPSITLSGAVHVPATILAGSLTDNPSQGSGNIIAPSISCATYLLINAYIKNGSATNLGYVVNNAAGAWRATSGGVAFTVANGGVAGADVASMPGYFGFGPDSSAAKAGGGPWQDTSDERIKDVLRDYAGGLAQIIQLNPVVYRFKGNDKSFDPPPQQFQDLSMHAAPAEAGTEYVGLIAQAAETVMPEMVRQMRARIDGVQVQDLRVLDTAALQFAVINALKEISARLDALEARK